MKRGSQSKRAQYQAIAEAARLVRTRDLRSIRLIASRKKPEKREHQAGPGKEIG